VKYDNWNISHKSHIYTWYRTKISLNFNRKYVVVHKEPILHFALRVEDMWKECDGKVSWCSIKVLQLTQLTIFDVLGFWTFPHSMSYLFHFLSTQFLLDCSVNLYIWYWIYLKCTPSFWLLNFDVLKILTPYQ
jgi:hypothetical protein